MPRGKSKKSADKNITSKKLKSSEPGSENVEAAHAQAEEDIQQDADLSIHSPNDDLDEGETARLGEDKTDLV